MKVAITGAEGFLGKHLRTRLRAEGGHDVVAIGRDHFSNPGHLVRALADADAVVHLAGANRGEPDDVETQNETLAERLISGLDAAGGAPSLVFANTVHAGTDTPYGRGKQRAYEMLDLWASRQGGHLSNVVYQNLFGEAGRPDHNSFVATFCARLAAGVSPTIDVDRQLELIHGQEAAQTILDVLACPSRSMSRTIETHGVPTSVSDVLVRLRNISDCYTIGTFPDLGDRFTRQLFNTYRSFLFPDRYPLLLDLKADRRGVFVESVRSTGGESQTSFSTTAPGVTRGNHFHLEKVERFLVLKGEARISIRPVYGSQLHYFDVSGDRPAVVDIPTLHTHSITNVGDTELLTLFWADEIYDPSSSDTFAELVS